MSIRTWMQRVFTSNPGSVGSSADVSLSPQPATPKRTVDVAAAAAQVEAAGKNPVAAKNDAAKPTGADLHKPLPSSSPVFVGCAKKAEPKVRVAESTVVSWVDDLRPMPDEMQGISLDEYCKLCADRTFLVDRRGTLVGASYSALGGTTLTVADEDGTLRHVDAREVTVESLAKAGTKAAWSEDLRPMPDEIPGVSEAEYGKLCADPSLLVERRGVIVGTSDGFVAGHTMTIAADDGRVYTVSADRVEIEKA